MRKSTRGLIYTGPLSMEYLKSCATALRSWSDQRARCNQKKHPCYKWYGAKGIRVEYTSRAFINWWLQTVRQNRLTGQIVCDRINPKGNYTFGNVQLITQAENAARQDIVNRRKVRHILSGNVYPSVLLAAQAHKLSPAGVIRHCKKQNQKAPEFEYA